MDTDFTSIFSNLTEIFRPYAELSKDVIGGASVVLKSYAEYASVSLPFNDILYVLRENTRLISETFGEFKRVYRAAEKLGEAQYVCWEPLSISWVDEINDTDSMDLLLEEAYRNKTIALFDEITDDCRNHISIKNNEKLFEESVSAFHRNEFEISSVGLIAVIDGALSAVSADAQTNLRKRADKLLDKLENRIDLNEEEYAFSLLTVTFSKTIDAFGKTVGFDAREPNELNRHWSMHGRNTRSRTELDCVKLLRLLKGITLIADIQE